METYQENRRFSDQYLPHVKSILGQVFFQESSFEVDTKEATDLVVLSGQSYKVACRIRRYHQFERYAHDFTIRSKLASCVETEYSKILRGFCDVMFYGFAAQNTDCLQVAYWNVLNLNVIRYHAEQRMALLPKNAHGETLNKDNTTTFKWFRIPLFPEDPPLVIASNITGILPSHYFWRPDIPKTPTRSDEAMRLLYESNDLARKSFEMSAKTAMAVETLARIIGTAKYPSPRQVVSSNREDRLDLFRQR